MNDYRDIINIKNWNPLNHERMSIEKRSYEFNPFSALTGYEEELKETRRIVDDKIILSEDKKEILDRKLNELINSQTNVKITYFIKDLKKQGGYYKKINSSIKKIDRYKKEIILTNNIKIKIDNIVDIE